MKPKNVGGRPSIDPYLKRSLTVRISPSDRDKLKQLGFTLSDGVMAAIADFTEKGQANEKH